MNLKCKFFFILLLFSLAGCSGGVFDRAYLASGDGFAENELQPDSQFNTTDDFNVVIKLHKHDSPTEVEVRFYDPNHDLMQTLHGTADSQTETLILGIDYEARTDQVNQWLRGRYQVEVIIGEKVVQNLSFRVD